MFEDFAVDEMVAHIDRGYRDAARWICNTSLDLALRRDD